MGKQSSRAKDEKEQAVIDRWMNQLNGRPGKKTSAGFPDIETDTTVYEVEDIRTWQFGLGQAIAYGHVMNSEPGLIIFGIRKRITTDVLDVIRSVCDRYKVTLLLDSPTAKLAHSSTLQRIQQHQVIHKLGQPKEQAKQMSIALSPYGRMALDKMHEDLDAIVEGSELVEITQRKRRIRICPACRQPVLGEHPRKSHPERSLKHHTREYYVNLGKMGGRGKKKTGERQ